MSRIVLEDAAGAFEVTRLDPGDARRVLLFAVGAGGDPERHLPMLSALAEAGCAVVAPHEARLVSMSPTADALRRRAARLGAALDAAGYPTLPVAGVGHSIGAAMLMGLAGARTWARGGEALHIPPIERIDRLALLAPATDFFRVPGALEAVRAEVLVCAGTEDALVPREHIQFLQNELQGRVPVTLRMSEGAGHFSFMHVPPPLSVEPLADRDAFLAELTTAVCRFVTA